MLSQALGSLFLSVICASAVQGAAFELPPLNDPPSSEHHVGKIVWADLVTPDVGAVEKFYGALFGWSFREVRAGSGSYVLASVNGRPVAGLVEKSLPAAGERHQSAWLTFIAVRDVDATKRTAVANKAKVLSDSVNYPMRGRQAVLADPEGAVFAILASTSGDSPDYVAGPGDFIWSSLHAKDPGAEAGFYQSLFAYDVFESQSEDGLDHLILSSDDYARASANSLPDGTDKRRAHWLNFVRVDNAAQIAGRVASLGGKVLVAPHQDKNGGLVAVIADPGGAPLGVLEWTEADTKEEPK